MKSYYFGCRNTGGMGHFLIDEFGESKGLELLKKLPWGLSIDGGLCEKDYGQSEGIAQIHHKDGWTVLAFWDRSVDTRPNSNSAFIVDKIMNFDQMIDLAKEKFPSIWARYGFEVREGSENKD